jgi:hypothetical protein
MMARAPEAGSVISWALGLRTRQFGTGFGLHPASNRLGQEVEKGAGLFVVELELHARDN